MASGHFKALVWLGLAAVLAASYAQGQVEPVSGTISRFCESCLDEQSALAEAQISSPPVQCDWGNQQPVFPPPPDLHCWSNSVRVRLGNYQSYQVFQYVIEWHWNLNQHVIRQETPSTDVIEASELIFDLRHALETLDKAYTVHNGVIGGEAPSITEGTVFVHSDASDCPMDTALDHILNPYLQAPLRDAIRSEWADILTQVVDNSLNAGISVSETQGFSATAGLGGSGVGYHWSRTTTTQDKADVLRFTFRFDQSEVETAFPFDDALVFDVTEADYSGHVALMDIAFRQDLSRAAGESVPELLSGEAAVDDPCVAEKFRDANVQWYEAPTGAGPIAPDDFPMPPGGGGMDLCPYTVWATVNGERQYTVTFMRPCDS